MRWVTTSGARCPSCDEPMSSVYRFKPGTTAKQIEEWGPGLWDEKAEGIEEFCTACGYKEPRR